MLKILVLSFLFLFVMPIKLIKQETVHRAQSHIVENSTHLSNNNIDFVKENINYPQHRLFQYITNLFSNKKEKVQMPKTSTNNTFNRDSRDRKTRSQQAANITKAQQIQKLQSNTQSISGDYTTKSNTTKSNTTKSNTTKSNTTKQKGINTPSKAQQRKTQGTPSSPLSIAQGAKESTGSSILPQSTQNPGSFITQSNFTAALSSFSTALGAFAKVLSTMPIVTSTSPLSDTKNQQQNEYSFPAVPLQTGPGIPTSGMPPIFTAQIKFHSDTSISNQLTKLQLLNKQITKILDQRRPYRK